MGTLVFLAGESSLLPESWFPNSWSGILTIATILGAIISYFATRKLRARIFSAYEEVSKVHQDNIAAQSKRITDLKEALEAMTVERNLYRDQKHDLANELNAAHLHLKEWETKPDFEALFEAEKEWHGLREIFYKHMQASQEAMLVGQKNIITAFDKLITRLETKKVI